MAASQTVVGNAALIKLGVATVVSFDDESKQARLLTQRFEALRDLEMSMHPWTRFTTRTQLSAEATAPAFGYAYQYVLPTDCMRLTRVGEYDAVLGLTDYDGGGRALYALEDGRILTDLGAPLNIRYVKRVADTTRWDSWFEEALACRIALDLGEPLTQSDTKIARAAAMYKDAIKEARRQNAIERAAESTPDSSWVMGRL